MVTQAQTSLKTVEQVGWGEYWVSLLLLYFCQTPLGKESRHLFCDDGSGPWISHQSIFSALCIPVLFFLTSFFIFFPVLLPLFGWTSSAHPSPWQKHLSLCSPAKAWCHSGSSSTDRELILPLLCLALPTWVDGKGWFWVELTMSSQLDLNCKTDDLCKNTLWCRNFSYFIILLYMFKFICISFVWSSNCKLILSLIYAALQRYKSEKTKQKLTKPSIKTVQRCC